VGVLAFLLALPQAPWNSLKPPQDELCFRAPGTYKTRKGLTGA
jgi:hypothetical protein